MITSLDIMVSFSNHFTHTSSNHSLERLVGRSASLLVPVDLLDAEHGEQPLYMISPASHDYQWRQLILSCGPSCIFRGN